MAEMRLAPLTFSQVEGSDICTVWASDGDELARIFGSLGLDEDSQDRARLIVQAVNSHDELVDALRVALAALINTNNCSGDECSICSAITHIKLALAKQEAQ